MITVALIAGALAMLTILWPNPRVPLVFLLVALIALAMKVFP